MTSTAGRPWLSSYADGVPAEIDVPDGSLVDLLEDSARRFADRAALDFFGSTTSYARLGEQVGRAAAALAGLGVRAGDRVALVLPSCPQHVVAFYAVLRLGAVVVEHNPLYTRAELTTQLADCGAEVAVVWDVTAPAVLAGRDRTSVRTVVAVDLTTALPLTKRLALRLPLPRVRATRAAMTVPAPGALSWDRLVAGAAPLPGNHPRPAAEDTALLQYTGGTTGTPKGAVLSHRNLRANAAQGRAWVPGLRDGEETVYGVLPLFHAYGLTLCLTFSVQVGATLVLFPRFDVDQVLAAVRRRPPTFLPAVPPVYARLADAARERGVDLTTVRYGISGAMSLPPDVVDTWEQVTGGLLVEGYGMTESSPITLGNPVSSARRPGTVGVPFPSTEVRVVDPEDTDRDVEQGTPGELLVRGPQVFSGYWRRPEETAAVLLPGGWLRTGDIVVMSEDGFVTVVDRIKELVITGGFNVYPSEVEDALRALDGVLDAAVVGLRAPDGSEQVAAAVVAEPGAILDPDALRTAAREHLAGYKVPRRVVVVDELPRSVIGKVLRRQVREQLEA
ncbi:long-chain-fatty-acid--CoA ligase [Aquipuribacter hungaricus]|uniref:Long-chain-fatty-acid--CoA ligase n=1 Tax=Aquipuribacter hungaricus TaxID=545624 RepID=A0ABV7WFA8_9MICO